MAHVKSVQRRSALRVACAYRTVSEEAICVIASKIPFEIQARELNRLYNKQGDRPTTGQKDAERLNTISEWQRKWERSTSGRWTFALIPSIEAWISRKHGEIDYHLTQILSGHGCFLEYLYKYKLADSPFCPRCPNEQESAEHVIFVCDRFAEERRLLQNAIGFEPTVSQLTAAMCSSQAKWNAVKEFAKNVMTKLQNIEKVRRQQQDVLQLGIDE